MASHTSDSQRRSAPKASEPHVQVIDERALSIPPNRRLAGAKGLACSVKIFLASSAELRADRDEFKLTVAARNDAWMHHGVLLQVVAWEHFLDLMSASRLQDDYNRAIAQCELFVMLLHTKVGRYTLEVRDRVRRVQGPRQAPFC